MPTYQNFTLFKSHLDLAHAYMQRILQSLESPIAVDATCGLGKDSLFIAQHMGLKGWLYCIDIQKTAIEHTRFFLEKNGYPFLENITLIHGSHENLEIFTPKADLIVYNLGYLPTGNKELTTQVASTLASIKNALNILKPSGLILITCYPGHLEGMKEEKALLALTQELDPKLYMVCHHVWPNRNRSPSLLVIQKKSL